MTESENAQEVDTPFELKMPKDIEKWIEFEKIVYRINNKNLKEALAFINKNFRMDQELMGQIIIDAYKFIPHRYEQLKTLMKNIDPREKKLDYSNRFIGSLLREKVINYVGSQPLNILFVGGLIKPPEKIFQAIEEDDLDQFNIYSSNVKLDEKKITFTVDNVDTTFSLFSYAALCGSLNCFKNFLINGSRVTDDVIANAVRGGNEEIVEMLTQQGISFKNTFSDALISHNNDLASWILDNYENKDIPPVFYVRVHNTEFLLNMFENFVNRSISFSEAFIFAVHSGNLPAVQCIYENAPKNLLKIMPTVLLVCVRESHLHMVKYIVRNKLADIETKDSKGYSPVNLAAHIGDVAIIKFLLDNKADINSQALDGSTPIISAAKQENLRAMNTLKSYGADLEIRDNSGKIATDYSQELSLMNIYN